MTFLAQCSGCGEMFEVPTARGMHLVMLHQIPCRTCFAKEVME